MADTPVNMYNHIARRRLLALSSIAFSGFAGCGEPRARTLELRILEVNKVDSEWVFSIRAKGEANGDFPDLKNVRVIGKSKAGNKICEKAVGDWENSENSRSSGEVEITCEEIPHHFTIVAEQSLCTGNSTSVQAVIYQGRSDSQHQWDVVDRCTGLTTRKPA